MAKGNAASGGRRRGSIVQLTAHSRQHVSKRNMAWRDPKRAGLDPIGSAGDRKFSASQPRYSQTDCLAGGHGCWRAFRFGDLAVGHPIEMSVTVESMGTDAGIRHSLISRAAPSSRAVARHTSPADEKRPLNHGPWSPVKIRSRAREGLRIGFLFGVGYCAIAVVIIVAPFTCLMAVIGTAASLVGRWHL